MLVVIFLLGFSNQKTLFLDILCFWVSFANIGVFFPMCGMNFYDKDHKLIVHVRPGTGVYRLILNDLGTFKVLLGVQSLEKLENCLTIFGLCLYL